MGLVYSQPACRAAYDGDVYKLYSILRTDPSQLDVQEEHNGDTPLIAACRRGNLHMVEYLLQVKANVQLTNKKQRTCLHYVSKRTFSVLDYLMICILMPILLLGYFVMLQKQRKTVELMKAVLSSRVNINAVDYKGNTALHYLCQKKSHHLVPLLLQGNAKTDIRNNDGETPLDIATRLKLPKIINVLKKTP
ncbi:ankyrin repeat domain-containing protein 22 [Kryptolebias marmoratus]|uniref:ankyrin repeat domain-containing protein 22 n=1 Tax=Kryptolebias marmoratus TaxID=37003 RepID=UPI0018ACA003|nr:ankyrin repeat domain-containing protein 22 [Kryptolebias marmoratus]